MTKNGEQLYCNETRHGGPWRARRTDETSREGGERKTDSAMFQLFQCFSEVTPGLINVF